MKKGRRHANRTTHNNQIDHGRGGKTDDYDDNDKDNNAMEQMHLRWWRVARGEQLQWQWQ